MKNYKTPWARVHCDWPDYGIHKPLESKAHTDNKSKEQYAEYVEAGHPDKQLQSKFIEVAGALGLDDPYVLINIQHPGQQMPIHTDLGSARRLQVSENCAQLSRRGSWGRVSAVLFDSTCFFVPKYVSRFQAFGMHAIVHNIMLQCN